MNAMGAGATPPWMQAPATGLRVGMVGTYPPTECGIASFTANLREAIAGARPSWELPVVRLTEPGTAAQAVEPVEAVWEAGDGEGLHLAARVLNGCDAVVLQHEYGIFGGRDGEDVLDLLHCLRVPVLTSAHTVLRHPGAHQRQVLEALLDGSRASVVPSHCALERLARVHGRHEAEAIPHGAQANFGELPVASPSRPTLLTWGLLSPGKGLEDALYAVANLAGDLPGLRYVIAGHTHPNELRGGRDPYREALKRLATELGIAEQVTFDNRYRSAYELADLVRSADVILLPYESREQVSSGVLVEAIASGKPTVATRFPHAVELLSGGAGVLVEHGDATAMADAVHGIVTNPFNARRMAEAARREASWLLWPKVGEDFATLVERCVVPPSGTGRSQGFEPVGSAA